MELDHPDAGAFFPPDDFWSHTLPVRRGNQEHHDVALPEIAEDAPPEIEREGGARPHSRNVSPLTSCSSIRTDLVCHLPEDHSLHLLSPRSRTAKSLIPLSDAPTPQARVGLFLEKLLLGKK